MDRIRTAVVGTRFMGRAHAAGIDDMNRFFEPGAFVEKAVLCGTDPQHTKDMAEKLGFADFTTDFQGMLLRGDIDAVHICTPVYEHFSQAMAAILCKKHVYCEKPMTLSVQESEALAYAAGEAGVVHQLGLNYRFVPAVRFARAMLDKELLGELYHFRGVYAQDWGNSDAALSWRFRKDKAGSGALGDIGTHLADLALYLVGDIERVSSTMRTFRARRPLPAQGGEDLVGEAEAGGATGAVDVDDAFCCAVEFDCGAIGTLEATRFATGDRNALTFEINGEKGSLKFDLLRLNELWYFDNTLPRALQGWRVIQCTDNKHPYGGKWWPVGHQLGWSSTFAHAFHSFYRAVATGARTTPDFGDGLRVARVVDAVERAYVSQGWEEV